MVNDRMADLTEQWAGFIGYEVKSSMNRLAWKIGVDLSIGHRLNTSHSFASLSYGSFDSTGTYFDVQKTETRDFSVRTRGLEFGLIPFLGAQYNLADRWDVSVSCLSFLYFADLYQRIERGNETKDFRYSEMKFWLGPVIGELSLFYKF